MVCQGRPLSASRAPDLSVGVWEAGQVSDRLEMRNDQLLLWVLVLFHFVCFNLKWLPCLWLLRRVGKQNRDGGMNGQAPPREAPVAGEHLALCSALQPARSAAPLPGRGQGRRVLPALGDGPAGQRAVPRRRGAMPGSRAPQGSRNHRWC